MNTENPRITQPTSVEKDPVCGMTVDPARAKATQEHSGKKYYFCCAGCMEKFRAEPGKYLKSPGLHVVPAPASKTLVSIAPMSTHPVQIALAPAHSSRGQGAPKSAAQPSLNVQAPNARAAANEFTCPMDPEVSQQRPGDCPQVGMALR